MIWWLERLVSRTSAVDDSTNLDRAESANAATPSSATREVREYHIDMTDRARRLRVSTKNTVYEIAVTDGARQEVLICGGLHFQMPRRARIAGTRFSSCELWRGSIYVGLRVELRVGDQALVTSPVRRIEILQ